MAQSENGTTSERVGKYTIFRFNNDPDGCRGADVTNSCGRVVATTNEAMTKRAALAWGKREIRRLTKGK